MFQEPDRISLLLLFYDYSGPRSIYHQPSLLNVHAWASSLDQVFCESQNNAHRIQKTRSVIHIMATDNFDLKLESGAKLFVFTKSSLASLVTLQMPLKSAISGVAFNIRSHSSVSPFRNPSRSSLDPATIVAGQKNTEPNLMYRRLVVYEIAHSAWSTSSSLSSSSLSSSSL